MNIRIKLAALAGIILGALFLGLPASAHTPTATPGAPCSHVGETGIHGVDHYVCQQKKTDQCPVWHHVPQPGASTTWTHKPCSCSSASATPSPSRTPSTPSSPSGSATAASSATPTASATPSQSVDVVVVGGGTTGSLPVTGPPVLVLVGVALLALVAGGTLVLVSYLRRHRTT